MMTIQEKILAFCKTPVYQQLNAYYGQSTVFNVLRVERSENRHTAFWAWLLNPEASHPLNEIPLRKFLALVATKGNDEYKCYYDIVRRHLIAGNYQLTVEDIKTEQSIIGLAKDMVIPDLEHLVEKTDKGTFKQDGQNRFDIWMLLRISFTDDDDKKQEWTLPLVIENKIYSKEGNTESVEKAQTVRYHRAVEIIKNYVCNDNFCQPLEVYLTPSGAAEPVSTSFIHLYYQDMLDHVLQPCAIMAAVQTKYSDSNVLIDGYIRNLSCPSTNDEKEQKDYSILGIADTERDQLRSLYDTDVFKSALCTVYPEAGTSLLGQEMDVDNDRALLEQFWNANENLFKMVLYSQFMDDKQKLKEVNRIVKVNNRDNTRYLVAAKQGEPWLNKGGKAVSKSEASYLIFKAYCLLQQEKNPGQILTVDDLRKAFGSELNNYYHNRFLKYLFYDFSQCVTVDIERSKYFDREILPESDDWDFYWDDDHVLPHVEGEVRSVKMWRKDDFTRLKDKAAQYGIVVESV